MRASQAIGLTVAVTVLMTSAGTGLAYDGLELKCRSTISKTLTKAITLGHKMIAGCHKNRDKKGGAVDCNVLDGVNADAKQKFAKSQTKIVAGVQTLAQVLKGMKR